MLLMAPLNCELDVLDPLLWNLPRPLLLVVLCVLLLLLLLPLEPVLLLLLPVMLALTTVPLLLPLVAGDVVVPEVLILGSNTDGLMCPYHLSFHGCNRYSGLGYLNNCAFFAAKPAWIQDGYLISNSYQCWIS